MKPWHSIIVFLLFVGCATLSGIHSYHKTEQAIIADMNQALTFTLQQKKEGWITPDTIQVYRSHLKIPALRRASLIYYAMDEKSHGLYSKRMTWQHSTKSVTFQGYANCSMASVLMMSDHTLPATFSTMAMIWLILSMIYFKNHPIGIVLGNLTFEACNQCFYDLDKKEIKFTPMQLQLLKMFFQSKDFKLSKQTICDTLWPKKPDASETLYALISRLKPVLEERARLQIMSERGRYYQLRKID